MFADLLFEPLRRRADPAMHILGRHDPPAGGGDMEDDIARAAAAKKGSPFLSTEQAAFYLGLSARKMQAMRRAGTGPCFRRHCRYVRYHIDDLDSWSGASGTVSGDG